MKKNKIIISIIAFLNVCVCLPLLFLLVPSTVPIAIDFHEKIILLVSKWWLVIGIIIPIILQIFLSFSKSKTSTLIFSELIIFVSYENMLGFSYFCAESNFEVGSLSQVPISAAVFLPLALSLIIYGIIVKNLPYKHKLGVHSKNITTTKFIWTQSQITASYNFMFTGLVLSIVSIVFMFIRFPLIEIAIFIIMIVLARILIENSARTMAKKYHYMKEKEEKIKG